MITTQLLGVTEDLTAGEIEELQHWLQCRGGYTVLGDGFDSPGVAGLATLNAVSSYRTARSLGTSSLRIVLIALRTEGMPDANGSCQECQQYHSDACVVLRQILLTRQTVAPYAAEMTSVMVPAPVPEEFLVSTIPELSPSPQQSPPPVDVSYAPTPITAWWAPVEDVADTSLLAQQMPAPVAAEIATAWSLPLLVQTEALPTVVATPVVAQVACPACYTYALQGFRNSEDNADKSGDKPLWWLGGAALSIVLGLFLLRRS